MDCVKHNHPLADFRLKVFKATIAILASPNSESDVSHQ
jgi:hypothetical protein